MKKITAIAAFVLFAGAASAQVYADQNPLPEPTTKMVDKFRQKDTVSVPVILFDRTDTMAVTVVFCVKSGRVRWERGYLLKSGYKTEKGGWAAQPSTRLINRDGDPFKEKVISVN